MPKKGVLTNYFGASLPKPELRRPPVRNLDLAECIMEEVALEGLDGITLQALLVRLSARPGFSISLNNEKAKSYIWEVVKRQRYLTIYLLEESRDDLVLHDRRDSVDDRGNMFEPVNAPEDIYPYHPVDDQKTGIRGSCKQYYTRRPYTSVARQMKYDRILELYGNRLVFVAPQAVREKVMTSDDSSVDLGDLSVIQYCIVERVARARYVGEITRGKVSLSSMKIDPKSSFYQRKLLLKKGIITKQNLSMKFGSNHISAGVTILHLPKFYTYYQTVLKSSVCKTIKTILATPNKLKEITQLRIELGKHQLHNLLSPECSQIFEEVEVPYDEAYPTAYAMERIPEKQLKLKKKIIKYLTLRDPRITPLNFTSLLLSKGGDEKEEADDPTVAHLPIRWYNDLRTVLKIVSELGFHSTQTSILQNFMHFIYEAKAKGTSLSELSEQMSVTQLDARTAVRLLQRHKAVIPIMEDKKKTKMNRYVFFKFKEANRNYQTVDKASLALTSSPSASRIDKNIFVDLESEQEALEGEIIWTVRELEIIAEESQDGTAVVEEILPNISSKTSRGRGQKVMGRRVGFKDPLKDGVKPRRGNSYLRCDDTPTPELKLSTAVRRIVEEFLSTCDPEVEEFQCNINNTEMRINQAEEKDFVPIREPEKARCLVYINNSGWQVLAELADTRADYGKLPSFATLRTTDRGNYILELIYKSRIVIGFQQILRGMRAHELSLVEDENQKSEIDRRTLYRILSYLQHKELIQILRVRIQKESTVKTCAVFTPFSVTLESKLVTSCIDHIVASTEAKVRQSFEQRKAKITRNRLIRRHAKMKPGLNITGVMANVLPERERTTVRARPGTKPGSKILRKVVKGARYANKATVKPKTRFVRKIDAADLEALARVKRVRVDWTSMEDRFILASFLASVLCIPRYNYQKIFMFNAPQIRDLLHMKVERGRCKTSLAIRRRLHFLMKKHAFYSRYRYYLSEALQDTFLYKKHLKKFHEKKTEKIFFRIPNERLLGVIEYLQEKFQKLSIDPNVIAREGMELDGDLPIKDFETDADLPEFENETSAESEPNPERRICIAFQQTDTCMMVDSMDTPFDPKSVAVWTARTAILSLVMTGDEVANVHRFLASVSDDILSYALNAMRLVGLTTWQKEATRYGPSLALKRKLQSFLGPEKYTDGANFLDEFSTTMHHNFPADEQASVGVFYLLCELSSQNLFDFRISLPDPIVTINPEWHSVFETIADGVDDDEYEEFITSDVLDDSNRWPKGKRPAGSSAEKNSTAQGSKRRKLNTRTEGDWGQNKLKEALRMGTDTSKFTPAKVMRLSNKAMRLIRTEINSNKPGNFVERDFFNVNLPGVEVLGDRDGFEQIIHNGAKPKLTLKEIKMHLVKIISYSRLALNDTIEIIPKPGKLGRWDQLYDYIASTKGIGISLQFLRTKFTRKTLNEGLRSLIIKNAIFLVGVTYRKFVAVEFVGSWTMPILHAQDSLILQRVVFRPWITSTGRVHWAVIDQTLSAVLGYVNLHPDLAVEALCDHFSPVLSPVETMIIIDALVGFEFFNLYSLERKIEKTTAFSMPSLVSKNYSVDTFLDMESLHVELHSLTASKYSKLQQLFTTEENYELTMSKTCKP